MNIGIILLAGSGTRLNNETPKQFIKVNNVPLYLYSVNTFIAHENIDKVLLVTRNEDISRLKKELQKEEKVMDVISGGETRQLSVCNALTYLKKKGIKDDDFVLIHDAARANISASIITESLIKLEENHAVNTVIPLSDSCIEVTDENIKSLDRDKIFLSQTPQSFHFGDIYMCHLKLLEEGITNSSDDISIALRFNIPVGLINGSKLNFKITTHEDLLFFESLKK